MYKRQLLSKQAAKQAEEKKNEIIMFNLNLQEMCIRDRYKVVQQPVLVCIELDMLPENSGCQFEKCVKLHFC